MARIQTMHKRTGDLMTARMYNEIIDSVNALYDRQESFKGAYASPDDLGRVKGSDGDLALVLDDGAFPAAIYRHNGTEWASTGKTWSPTESIDLAAYAKSIDLAFLVCGTAAATAAKVVTAAGYALKNGGNIRIRMTNANTAEDATLNINATGDVPLYYDGERASSANTWEAGETIIVYYDAAAERYMACNVDGGGQFATGEKVRKTGVDPKPKTGNTTSVVTSDGVARSVRELIEAMVGRQTPSWSGTGSSSWPSMADGWLIFSGTGISITREGKFAVPGSTQPSRYQTRIYAMKKGTVIHAKFGLKNSAKDYIRYGFLTDLPRDGQGEVMTGDDLKNALLDSENPYNALDGCGEEMATTGNDIDMVLVMPYDGYFAWYNYHNASSGSVTWDTATWVCEIYEPARLPSMVDELPTAESGNLVKSGGVKTAMDNMSFSMEEGKVNSLVTDFGNSFSWVSCGSSNGRDANTSVSTDEETGVTTIEILVDQSGSRFGLYAYDIPKGRYIIEFDSTQRLLGGTFYNKRIQPDTLPNTDFLPEGQNINTAHRWQDNHYTLVIETQKTQTFYLTYANQSQTPHAAGTVITISNFKVTKVVRDLSDITERLVTTEKTLDSYKKTIIKEGAMGVNPLTVEPSPSDTYTAYKTGSGDQFKTNGKRLCYFPKYKVAGNQPCSFKYTGLNAITVYQLAEKEGVDIDSSPIGKYTVSEVMMKTIGAPANSSEQFIEQQDENGLVTVNFTTHPRCSRLAFVMGATQNITQNVENITDNITELTLPVYDEENIDFSVFVKKSDFDSLQDIVQSDQVPSLEAPKSTKHNYYEITADNTIVYHGGSSNYKLYHFNNKLDAGTRVMFYGEYARAEGRARRWALSDIDPSTVEGMTLLPLIEDGVSVVSNEQKVYDEEGNYLKTIVEQNIILNTDGYLLTYYYNKNWITQKSTFYYKGALPDIINTLTENSGDSGADVRQAKFFSNGSQMEGTLGLIHFGDIHGDSIAATQLLRYIDKYADYIDDVITSGDVVEYDVNTDNQIVWWKGTGLAESTLFVLGNHDCATKNATEFDQKEAQSGGRAWNGMGKAWGHDTFFAPYIENWGVTMPEGYDDPTSMHYKACYWHKDYEEQKIRLLGLDCMNYFDGILDENLSITKAGFKNVSNIGQETWLAARLAEAKELDYSVVVMCHYPLDDTETTSGVSHANVLDVNGCNTSPNGGFVMNRLTGETTSFTISLAYSDTAINSDKRFCLRNRNGLGTFDPLNAWVDYSKGDINNIGDILQRYINDGGKFVVWLCGHYHTFHMFYPKKYPSMLTIAVGQAGNNRGSDWAYRPSSDPFLRTLANYISIDTTKGWIKFVRLGLTTDYRMRKTTNLCYDYKNKRVVSEG